MSDPLRRWNFSDFLSEFVYMPLMAKNVKLVEPEDDEAEHDNKEEDCRAVIDFGVEN